MSVNVLETILLHADGVLYWLDGTSAENGDPSRLQRIPRAMSVAWSDRPSDLMTVRRSGALAFWRRIGASYVDGLASEAQRARTAPDPYTLAGVVAESQGDYNPRRFTLTVNAGEAKGVLLYPSPKGTHFNGNGGLYGTVRFDADQSPAAWGLLELTVQTAPGQTMTFLAQADGHGDFRLSLTRLPPLPKNVADYQADLSVIADAAATAETPADPTALAAMEVAETDGPQFMNSIPLRIEPGAIVRITSDGRDYLAVRPE